MEHSPTDGQERIAPACSDYYTTGVHCRPPKEKKTRNFGWLAAAAGVFLLCMAAWMGMDPEPDVLEPEQAAAEQAAAEHLQLEDMADSGASAAETSRLLPTVDAEVRAAAPGATLTVSGTQTEELTLPEIYRKVIPSVVSVTADTQSGTSSGTGIIMSEDGYIITNCHVISGGESITVLLTSGEELAATLVGADETSDLAVLKVGAQGLTPAEFGDSDSAEVGQSVVAIGDPLGTELRGTMTDGIVCGIQRDVQVGDRTMTLMQTNAALNAGNSGGPLVNLSGQVIGINTMKLRSYYTSVEGIGFAIPISAAQPIIDELVEKGYVSGRPAFGFTVETLSAQMRLFYKLPGVLYIRSVSEGSDAAAQGISPGDVIVSVDGERVSSLDEFNTAKNRHTAGDTVALTVFRKGEELEFSVTLMDRADLD